ncbi:MAG: LysM peptidoglycan-binding domain-containing protein, partial [Nostocoides sp.]
MVVAHPPAVVHAGPPPTAVHQSAHPAPYGWQLHVVRRGESVSALSITYRTTISAIAAKNHLRDGGRLIAPGQKLWMPRTTPVQAVKPAAKPAAKPAPAPRRTYLVRAGDTLSHIAVAHEVPLAAVLKLNRMQMS